MTIAKITDSAKITTDPEVLRELDRQGIDKDYVEFFQDYAPRNLGKEHSPCAKFYRDLKSNKRFMVVSGLPMVKPDGTKIEAGWVKQGNGYISKPNLFSAIVKGKQITLTCLNDQPTGVKTGDAVTYQPQLFLDDVEQLPISDKPTLLPIDPMNENYQQNTLEWDYGICKRRLRIIEGSVLGSWVFPSNPNGEIRIKYNQTGNFKLKLGQYRITDDEEIISQTIFNEAEYPFEVRDTATFYPDPHIENTSVDGSVQHYEVGLTWAQIIAAVGTAFDDSQATNLYGFMLDAREQTTDQWRGIIRGIILFDTSGLPNNAIISDATLSIYASNKRDTLGISPDINVYSSAPASNTALEAGDYNSLGDAAFSTAITYANWTLGEYNDFTLNANGIAAISLTAISKFGLRNANYDVTGNAPSWSANVSDVIGRPSEYGAGYKPKLVVTYTVPDAPTLTLRYTSALISANPNWRLRNILVHDNVMYLCEEDNNRVSSWTLANPLLPVLLDEITMTTPLDIKLSSDGTHVFVTGGSANAIFSIDIRDPGNLVLDDTLTDATYLIWPHGCYRDGDFLYVTCYFGDMFTIVDVSNPTNLTLRGSLQQASLDGVHDVVVAYPYAYVASHFGSGGGASQGEVTCINIADPDAPSLEAISTQKSSFAHIIKSGNYLYVGGADPSGFLYSFDISAPTTLTFADKLATGYGYWLARIGSYILSADNATVLSVVDISDPTDMIKVRAWSQAGVDKVRNVVIHQSRYVYITCQETATGGKFKVLELEGLPSGKAGLNGVTAKLIAAGLI